MLSLKNETININVISNNRNKNYKVKNRLLNNSLNSLLASKRLTQTTANALFPELVPVATSNISTGIMNVAYLKFDTTQVIDDTSTTMNYDVRYSAANPYTITSGFDGKTLKGIGFGYDDGSQTIFGAAAYLNSFVDISFLDIVVKTGDIIILSREDLISTNLSITQNAPQFMETYIGAPGRRHIIDKITFCYNLNGVTKDKEYRISDLIVTKTGIGEITITGFDPFESNQIAGLYPIFYPGTTTFPSNPEQYKSVIYDYIGTNSLYTPNGQDAQTTANIRDLDITFDNGIISIKYKIERGA